MAIAIGQQIGSYEITALLGKGGMGEVYRARDTKLKREVAIKILPDEFSRDAARVSRFQREAEVLACSSVKTEPFFSCAISVDIWLLWKMHGVLRIRDYFPAGAATFDGASGQYEKCAGGAFALSFNDVEISSSFSAAAIFAVVTFIHNSPAWYPADRKG
jgi:serine/threonine protein kinase